MRFNIRLVNNSTIQNSTYVLQILAHKLQLAAYSGFHGTTTPLHRAVQAGHIDTCCVILDLIKARIKAAELAVEIGKEKPSTLKRWKSFQRRIIDQRSHQSLTPLMIACQRGHADIVALLLANGADAMMVDIFHCRTALHYAAIGGHADCIRVLCNENTMVIHSGREQCLRDVVTSDFAVQTAKYVDLRAFGGLTALHFAVISGRVDALQALLSGGAATMPKTENEAFIKEEYVTPGSTPLHIAVITANIPMAHALLQAHADLMSAAGSGERDERHRRVWEGHSRTDVRSVRNAQRKLPYHLARERGLTQLVHLVDPRISIDASLDVARDTEYGIGPKALSTMASMVMQSMMMGWLDKYEEEMKNQQQGGVSKVRERMQERRIASSPGDVAVSVSATPCALSGSKSTTLSAISRSSSNSDGLNNGLAQFDDGDTATPRDKDDGNIIHTPLINNNSNNNNANIDQDMPLAGSSVTPPMSPRPASASTSAFGSANTTTTAAISDPRERDSKYNAPKISGLASFVRIRSAGSLRTLPSCLSIHGKSLKTVCDITPAMTDLSCDDSNQQQQQQQHERLTMVRAQSAGALPSLAFLESSRRVAAAYLDGSLEPQGKALMSGTRTSNKTLSNGSKVMPVVTINDSDDTATESLDSLSSSTASMYSAEDGSRRAHGSNTADLHTARNNFVHAALYAENSNSFVSDECTVAGNKTAAAAAAAAFQDFECECGICLDQSIDLLFSSCHHGLCLGCARNLTKQAKKPPSCPFCRKMITSFEGILPLRPC